MTKKENKKEGTKKVFLPKATALWLIDNTSLTFKQIADFCDLTEIEIKMIADGIIANTIYPSNPIEKGILTQEEISKREKDGESLEFIKDTNLLSISGLNIDLKQIKQKKFISTTQKQSRPDAVLWLITKHPELSDQQIVKLLRTTRSMVQAIREKTYKNYENLFLKDPVLLGFCSQTELNNEIEKAQKKVQKQQEKEINKQKKAIRKINVNKVKVVKQKVEARNNKKKKVKEVKNPIIKDKKSK